MGLCSFIPKQGYAPHPSRDRTVGRIFKSRSARQKWKHTHPQHGEDTLEIVKWGGSKNYYYSGTQPGAVRMLPTVCSGWPEGHVGKIPVATAAGQCGHFRDVCLHLWPLVQTSLQARKPTVSSFPKTYFNGKEPGPNPWTQGPYDTTLSCFCLASFGFVSG